jgi:hypothetical protein
MPEEREQIPTLRDLEQLLSANGIDLTAWGQGEAKRLEDLFNEIEAGESRLQVDPLLRLLAVVQVNVRGQTGTLVEAEQELADGRRRPRNQPPLEKIKAGEQPVEVAVRCLMEELGMGRERIFIDEGSCRLTLEVKDSPSYPGLRGQFLYHAFEARVEGLLDADFWTDETADNEKDPVRRHHWVWK